MKNRLKKLASKNGSFLNGVKFFLGPISLILSSFSSSGLFSILSSNNSNLFILLSESVLILSFSSEVSLSFSEINFSILSSSFISLFYKK